MSGPRVCSLSLWEAPEGLRQNGFSGVVWSSQLAGGLWRKGERKQGLKGDVLVSWGCRREGRKRGGLANRNLFSQFWRLHIQNHGVDRAVLPQETLREDLSLPLPVSGNPRYSLVYGSITPTSVSVFEGLLTSASVCLCASMWHSPCVSVSESKLSLFLKGHQWLD